MEDLFSDEELEIILLSFVEYESSKNGRGSVLDEEVNRFIKLVEEVSLSVRLLRMAAVGDVYIGLDGDMEDFVFALTEQGKTKAEKMLAGLVE